MTGKHRAPRRTRWIAGAAALVAAGSTWLAFGPAQAAGATVDAQLTLSGVATSSSPTGGSTVGVHPGDSVNLTAASIPSAGLPGGLGSTLTGLLAPLAKFQVVLTSGNLPGVSYPYKLGQASGDHAKLTLADLNSGTYHFTYRAQSVTVLGAAPVDLTGSQLNALSNAGIPLKLNASNQYVGSIVAANDPPKGGISVQLPSTRVSVSAGPIHVNPSLPGVVAPTLSVPTSLPTAGNLPGLPGGSKSTQAGDSAKQPSLRPPSVAAAAPIPETVPEMVVPKGSGNLQAAQLPGGTSGLSAGYLGVPAQHLTGSLNGGPGSLSALSLPTTGAANPVADAPQQIELASSPSAPSGVPVLLAIVAVVALGTVIALYAKCYLVRRPD